MNNRIIIALAGTVTVSAYAALMAYESLVLGPLAVVPGASLGEIHARLTESGVNVQAAIASVIRSSVFGVGLAIIAAAVGLWRRLSPFVMMIIFLAIVAAGAVPTLVHGAAHGADVAYIYGLSGGAHTIWTGVLYLTSLAALVGIVVLSVLRRRWSTNAHFGETRLRP
jgi:hypothetical protein